MYADNFKLSGFVGAAKRLENQDLPRIGARIGVGEDELHAFMEVEAANSGFDSKGRPKMLFEPHVFYRNLSGAKRSQAVKAGLAYAKWKSGSYPKDSYPRLQAAMAIDETAALKAASWGLGQILGENHGIVGYATVQAMVLAFMADEEHHLAAIVEFLIATKIADDLKAHRWDVVASVYNGPGYKTHNYHGRMAKAYARWAGIPDTPWDGSAAVIDAVLPSVPVSPNASSAREIQHRLTEHGFPVKQDGVIGPKTRAAVKDFQEAKGLKVDGIVGPVTWAALQKSPHKDAAIATVAATGLLVAAPAAATVAAVTWETSDTAIVVGIAVAVAGYVLWRNRQRIAGWFGRG